MTVGLTTKGNDELTTAYYAQNAREQEVFGNISPDDLHQLIELMRRVIKTYPRSP